MRRAATPLLGVAAAGAAVVGVAALLVLGSPRHRAFYLGEVGGSATPDTTVTAGARGAPATGPMRVRPVSVDARGRVVVPLADTVPWTLPADGAPPGWALKEFAGQADVELERAEGRLAIHLRSDRSSFALYRDVVVDPVELPLLSWSWNVARLPTGGDVRDAHRDDQAAQLYVVFPRWPSPLTRSDVVGYVWDTTAPVETRVTSTRADNVRIIVVESGRQHLGAWRRYERNVLEDYTALFGRRPPRVGKIAIMIDSNDTRGEAEARWATLGFARAR